MIRHFFSLFFSVLLVHAVQLEDLVGTRPDRLSSSLKKMEVYPDGSLLIHANSGRTQPVSDFTFHPLVQVDASGDGLVTLFARVYPNSTVAWASVVTSMHGGTVTTIDKRGNVYAAAQKYQRAPLQIFKFAPNGTRVYTRSLTNVRKKLNIVAGIGTWMGYDSRLDRLVMVANEVIERNVRFVVLSFQAETGAFQKAYELPFAGRPSWRDFSVDHNAACVTSEITVRRSRTKTILIQCVQFASGKIIETQLKGPDSISFSIRTSMEENRDRRSILGVAYERVIASTLVDGEANTHELVVCRLDAKTLQEVDESECTVIGLPAPLRLQTSTRIRNIRYSSETRSASVFVDSIVKFEHFIKNAPGEFTVQGRALPDEIFRPRSAWVFQIDESGDLFVRELKAPQNQVFNYMDVADYALSSDGRTGYVYGHLDRIRKRRRVQKGPLQLYAVQSLGKLVKP